MSRPGSRRARERERAEASIDQAIARGLLGRPREAAVKPAPWYIDGDLVRHVAFGPAHDIYHPSVHVYELLVKPFEAMQRGEAALVDMITSEPLSLVVLEDALRRLRGERVVLR